MTPQEVFDKVVTHLRKQGRSSRNGKCLYRYGDLKCAAGCLIEDEEYRPFMDGDSDTSIGRILHHPDTPVSMRERLAPHLELISSLQNLHDNRGVPDWENELSDVARDFDLQYTPSV